MLRGAAGPAAAETGRRRTGQRLHGAGRRLRRDSSCARRATSRPARGEAASQTSRSASGTSRAWSSSRSTSEPRSWLSSRAHVPRVTSSAPIDSDPSAAASQSARLLPVAPHGAIGDAQRLAGLLVGETRRSSGAPPPPPSGDRARASSSSARWTARISSGPCAGIASGWPARRPRSRRRRRGAPPSVPGEVDDDGAHRARGVAQEGRRSSTPRGRARAKRTNHSWTSAVVSSRVRRAFPLSRAWAICRSSS